MRGLHVLRCLHVFFSGTLSSSPFQWHSGVRLTGDSKSWMAASLCQPCHRLAMCPDCSLKAAHVLEFHKQKRWMESVLVIFCFTVKLSFCGCPDCIHLCLLCSAVHWLSIYSLVLYWSVFVFVMVCILSFAVMMLGLYHWTFAIDLNKDLLYLQCPALGSHS